VSLFALAALLVVLRHVEFRKAERMRTVSDLEARVTLFLAMLPFITIIIGIFVLVSLSVQ
jgi:hypothetical protein